MTAVFDAKRAKWAELRTEHARRMAGTFTAGGKTFTIDQPDLALAMMDAFLAQRANEAGWQQRWPTADGPAVLLSAAQMLALGRARHAAVAALSNTLESLRDQLRAIDNNTGTLAQVAAVVWP